MIVNPTKNPYSIISIFWPCLDIYMTSLIKIQSFKLGKNDDNYASKVLEAAL